MRVAGSVLSCVWMEIWRQAQNSAGFCTIHKHRLGKEAPVVCCEKQSCVVDWPLPKIPRDMTLVAGALLFLAVLWSSIWTVLIGLGSRVLISNCVSDFLPFPTLLWSSIWTVLIELGSRVLISNCVSDFLPFVSYSPVK